MRLLNAIAIFGTSVTLLLANPASSHAAPTVRVGILECYVAAGSGFVVGSSKDISCTYIRDKDQAEEHYFGAINKYGVDIGFTEESFLEWAIYAPAEESFQPGFLQGDYVGASATISASIGLGANVLIGGLRKSFALEPVNFKKQRGVNIALGIAEMELRSINAK